MVCNKSIESQFWNSNVLQTKYKNKMGVFLYKLITHLDEAVGLTRFLEGTPFAGYL